MVLLAHKLVRKTALGLMFILAATALCWCDSYDPDPYDDIPPVVTVEFNYFVPALGSVSLPSAQTQNVKRIQAAANDWQTPVIAPEIFNHRGVMASLAGPNHMVIPLRR